MAELLVAGIVAAVVVGVNVGGSSTGVAFGPAVGANTISQVGAGVLMSLSALVGGWTVGRNVITTVGHDIVAGPAFSLSAGLLVLMCIGGALFVANLCGVPASTSMVAVGAMVGMGLSSAGVHWWTLVEIVGWWLIAPSLAFSIAAAIGRYRYRELAATLALDTPSTALVTISWKGVRPRLTIAPDVSRAEVVSTGVLLLIACYMGFSAGASNVANAVAPLVGSGALSTDAGVVIAVIAIAIGAFTIARRTMATVGNDLTKLPLVAACLVAMIGATITTGLAAIGIPASLALATVAAIIGLGWGRTCRARQRPEPPLPATRAESVRADTTPVYAEHPSALTMLSGRTVTRVLAVWTLAPLCALIVALLGGYVIS